MPRSVGGWAGDLSDRERPGRNEIRRGNDLSSNRREPLHRAHNGSQPSLCNLPQARRAHKSGACRFDRCSTSSGTTAQHRVRRPPSGDPGRPVVAVVPIENLSGDEFWTRLADGLSADIIIDLARYSDLAVIARQTMTCYKGRRDDVRSIGRELNADYVLAGTLQAAGQDVRIAVQLIDARTEVALWTTRYERSAEDLFAMQDSITENVVNVLASCRGKIANLGCIAARRKQPANLGAYDCYLLGVEACHKLTLASNREAIRLQSRAVELDPGLARAWAALGMAYSVEVLNAYSSDPAESRERWNTCLEKALALDPADSTARVSLGELRALQGDLKGCERGKRRKRWPWRRTMPIRSPNWQEALLW